MTEMQVVSHRLQIDSPSQQLLSNRYQDSYRNHHKKKGKLIAGKLRLTTLCGTEGKHYFEFPQNLNELLNNDCEQYE